MTVARSTQGSVVTLVYAVTAHGLGHWTRSACILNALGALAPSIRWIVSGAFDAATVSRSLTVPYRLRQQTYEIGAAHGNCFELDEAGTRGLYARFFQERESRLTEEVAFLRKTGAQAVLTDIPALPVRAAAELGLPVIGISNFTWDWVLEPIFAGTTLEWIPRALAEDYSVGTRHLRLPFGPELSPFAASEPAPLLGRHARMTPAQVRSQLELPSNDGRRLVLVCPGGWQASDWPDVSVPDCAGYRFVTVGDLPITFRAPSLALPHELPAPLTFPDLVAASDMVIAKPGYGIASECLLHRTPMIAVERPRFRETPVLLSAMRRLGPTGELSLEDFFRGRWEPAIEALLASTTPWGEIPEDGAHQVATRLADLLAL